MRDDFCEENKQHRDKCRLSVILCPRNLIGQMWDSVLLTSFLSCASIAIEGYCVFFFKQAICVHLCFMYLFTLWMKQPFASLGRGCSQPSDPLCFCNGCFPGGKLFLLPEKDLPPGGLTGSQAVPFRGLRAGVGGAVLDSFWPIFCKPGAERGLCWDSEHYS